MCIVTSMHSTNFHEVNNRLVYLAGESVKDEKKGRNPKLSGCAHICMCKEKHGLSVTAIYSREWVFRSFLLSLLLVTWKWKEPEVVRYKAESKSRAAPGRRCHQYFPRHVHACHLGRSGLGPEILHF